MSEVVDETLEDLQVSVAALDQRLKLSQCESPLNFRQTHSGRRYGRVSVQVRCEDGLKPWSLYVQATIAAYVDVVVAARALPRGHVIGRDDLTLRRTELDRLASAALRQPESALGKELTRQLAVDMPLTLSMLKQPLLVNRGEQVVIVAQSGTLSVKMAGVALTAGAEGDTIRVKNSSSGKEIEAVVIGVATVEVRM